MSFLGRIAQQSRSPASGHAVARPKGQLPSLPTMTAPVDRPAHSEPVASQTEPSVTIPEAVPPAVAGPSDETPPAASMPEPGTSSRPEQSALDQRPAAVAGTAGTRPEPVGATDFDRPQPPAAADAETAHGEAFGRRDQEPVVRVEINDLGTVAPPADEQQDSGDRPAPVASAQEPFASPPETSPDQVSRLQPAEPAPAEASIGQLDSAATVQETPQANTPSDQPVAGAGHDQGEPPTRPEPVQQAEDGTEDGTSTPQRDVPPVLEPMPAPQPERYRPAPVIQPPAAEQPPLLQIDQIDVVVSDPAPAQPAAPARSRLAAISASRRYLRRL